MNCYHKIKNGGIIINEIGSIEKGDPRDSGRYLVKFTGKKELVPMRDYQMELAAKGKNISISFAPQPLPPIQNLENIIKGPILHSELAITKNNKKEENNMEILDLYKERKVSKIENDALIGKDKILEEDEIQKIFKEMINQVNVILENEGSKPIDMDLPVQYKEFRTAKTNEKLGKLVADTDRLKHKLYSDYEEIKAMLSMTNDYQEQIKILKNYGIIDKKTNKLSI